MKEPVTSKEQVCPHPTLYARDMFNQPQPWGSCLLCDRERLTRELERLRTALQEVMQHGCCECLECVVRIRKLLSGEPSAVETAATPRLQEAFRLLNAATYYVPRPRQLHQEIVAWLNGATAQEASPEETSRKPGPPYYCPSCNCHSCAPERAEKASPPHPGPSIEKAFARSPRRVSEKSSAGTSAALLERLDASIRTVGELREMPPKQLVELALDATGSLPSKLNLIINELCTRLYPDWGREAPRDES